MNFHNDMDRDDYIKSQNQVESDNDQQMKSESDQEVKQIEITSTSATTNKQNEVAILPLTDKYITLSELHEFGLLTADIDLDISKFWNNINDNYKKIISLAETPSKYQETEALLNSYLSEILRKYVHIYFTYGMINNQYLEVAKNLLEIYISPLCDIEEGVTIMKKIYNNRNNQAFQLQCSICMYRPYSLKDSIIYSIEVSPDVIAKISDFVVQCSYGYKSVIGYKKNMPVLNLAIFISDKIAHNFIEKKLIKIMKDSNTSNTFNDSNSANITSERYMQNNYRIIDRFLCNIIGEHHYLHHIGYIELTPIDFDNEDFKLVEVIPLYKIKEQLDFVLATYKYRSCTYCNKTTMQSIIYTCQQCHTADYCSSLCQRAMGIS